MSPSDKTNFKVSLDLDVTVDEEGGLVPDVIVRDITVTKRPLSTAYERDEVSE